MLQITLYLIENTLVAMGLAILVALCIYNVLRRQVRVALAAWLLILVVLFYIHSQVGLPMEYEADLSVEEIVQP